MTTEQPPQPKPLSAYLQADYEKWNQRQREKREAAEKLYYGDSAAAEAAPARKATEYTPEQLAEHEAWRQKKIAEDKADQQARAFTEWRAHCPPILRETNFDDPRLLPWKKQIDQILGWKNDGRGGIYAVGESGKGKSRSVWARARIAAVDELIPTRYLLQNEITNEVNRDGLTGWLEKMSGLRNIPLLVWDDFGKFAAMGSRKDLLASEIEALIDYRFHHGKPTLISSNVRGNDFAEIFGELRAQPIMRRLIEGSFEGKVIDFDSK